MNLRFYQIWLTYIRRRPFWLLGIAYVAVCGIALNFAVNGTGSRQHTVSPEPSFNSPVATLRQGVSISGISPKTRSLYFSVQRGLKLKAPVAHRLPKVSSLQIVGELDSSDDLWLLQSLPNLQYFSLLGDLPVGSLRQLVPSQRLRYLRLLEVSDERDLKSLEQFTELQTLVLMRVTDYGRLFEHLARLPRLRTLAIPGQVVSSFKPADWEQLRGLSPLKRIYLSGNLAGNGHQRMELDAVQKLLPGLKVRPAVVSDQRSNVWCFTVLAGMLIWTILTIQLQAQFSHMGARLIPDYAICHLTAASLLWGGTTLFHIIVLCVGGGSFLGSLAGTLVVPGLYWGLQAGLLRSRTVSNRAGTLNPMFSLAVCFQVFPIIAFASRFFLSDLDWFLDGHQPVPAILISALSLLSPALVMLRIPQLNTIYEECPAGIPPLQMNPTSWMKWGKQLSRPEAGSWQVWWRGDQGDRLDQLLHAARPLDWPRLWRAAHGIDLTQLVVRMMLFTAAFLVGGRLFLWLVYGDFDAQPQWVAIVALIGGMWTEGTFIALILLWRGRRPMLGFELMHPATRKEFVEHLFGAVWRDLLPVFVGACLLIACLSSMINLQTVPPLFFPAVMLYGLFRAVSNYATILLLLAVRRGWCVWAAVGLIWFATFYADAYLALSSSSGRDWFPEFVIPACLVATAAAVGCLFWLKGYWQRIELA